MFLLRLGMAVLALSILGSMFNKLEERGTLHLHLADVFAVAFLICLIAFVVLAITHLSELRSKD